MTSLPAQPWARHAGVVTVFDDDRGYGTVSGGDGGKHEWFFHCTSIADGSRTIAVGTAVTFTLLAGRRGQWEAMDLR